MENKYKIHDLGQPDWVQLGVEVDAWDFEGEKTRGVLVGYMPGSCYPYQVKIGTKGIQDDWKHAEPVRQWVPQPGELVVVRIANAVYLRVSAGGSNWIPNGRIGKGPITNIDYQPYIYRLPEGVPLHELSPDLVWWEVNAEKYKEED